MLSEWLQAIYKQDLTHFSGDSAFYKELMTILKESGTASQIYTLLKNVRGQELVPHYFSEYVKAAHENTLMVNLLLKRKTDQLLQALEVQELNVIPLKGVYFSEDYFGHYSARPTSDIDLLIHQKDFESVKACIMSQGFTGQETLIPGHFHHSFSSQAANGMSLTVEIHWTILKEDTSRLDVAEFWRKAVSFSTFQHVKKLSDEDLFYMMVLHSWRHNLESLRFYLDLIQLIHVLKKTIDYVNLLMRADNDLTFKRVVRTLSKVYYHFPFLNEVKPFPNKIQKWFWCPEAPDNLKKYVDFMDYQFMSYDTLQHRIKEAFNWLVNEKLKKSSV